MKSLMAGLLIIATAGCAHGASTDTIQEARTKLVELHITRAPETVKALNKLGSARIEKFSEHAICSGAFVTSNGGILTARHCTEGATSIDVITVDGEYKATVVAQSDKHDLALIMIDTSHEAHFKVASEVRVGETIYVLGSPLGLSGTLSQGIIARHGGDVTYIDCGVLPGNSGGPVFDEDGNLVGIATAGFIVLYGTTHLNIMQSIEAITGFAKSLR